MRIDFTPIERFILEKISETRIPGLSIAVVKDNEVIYRNGFGYRDLKRAEPITPRTLFGIGSVTKSFTALAILKLVEEDKISLDDSIEHYVPLKIRPFGEEITIHHLLTHSSGIPALAYAEAFIRSFLGIDHCWLPICKPEDVITFMSDAQEWVEAKPGEKFFYLNEGYVLLGYIISKVSGMRYEDFVREKILKPLKMNRSYFFKEEVEKDGNWATPYMIDKEGRHIPTSFPFGITADGGLISNVLDLSNYIMMYLNNGEFDGKRIIDRGLLKKMLTGYIKVPWQLWGGESYGYGWIITPNFHGHTVISHSGSVLVHTAYVGFIPEKKLGVAILANASGYPLSFIGMYVLTYLLGKDPEKLPFVKNDRILRKLVGTYKTYKGTMSVDVVREGDFLYIVIKDKLMETRVPLIPSELEEDRAIFYTLIRGVKYTIEFHIKPDRIELLYERYKLVKRAH